MEGNAPIIREYEVFSNDREAVAIFFFRHAELDNNDPEGPFWFTAYDDSIIAGTEAHNVTFPNVLPEVMELVRARGAIVLMEFEGQTPVRVTPCYLAETL